MTWKMVGISLVAGWVGMAHAKTPTPTPPKPDTTKQQPQQQGLSPATATLLDALALGLPPEEAAAALDALAAGKHEKETVDVIVRYASYRDPAVRARAVYALGVLDDARARATILRAIGDQDKEVRSAAGRAAAIRKDLGVVKPLLTLLKKGDETAVASLAAVANADVARQVAELVNEAPDALVAQCLGLMLLRKDLGPEQAYVDVVRALGKIPGNDAVVALTGFIGSVPESSPRPSRKEAQAIYEQRLGGGGN
jgi:HEAT repeat protein